VIFFHGTDVESGLALLNGGNLDETTARAAHIDGPLGFYLCAIADEAEFFGARRGEYTILIYDLSQMALEALGVAGAPRRPIPGGRTSVFVGDELYVPPAAFDTFNQLVKMGEINVRPYRR
jgi:hypothetical protein